MHKSIRRVLGRTAIVGVLGALATTLSAPAAGAADVPTPIGRFGDYVPVFQSSSGHGANCEAPPAKQWINRDRLISSGSGSYERATGAVTATAETLTGTSGASARYRQDIYSTFYRAADNHLHVVSCDHTVGTFTDGRPPIDDGSVSGNSYDLGGGLTSSPSGVSRSNGDGSSTSFVFARGVGGDLWYWQADSWPVQQYWNSHGESGHWHGLGGSFVGDPVAVTSNNGSQIDVFVVNQSGQLWDARSTDGVHFAWRQVGNANVGANWTNITAAYVVGEFRIVQMNTSTREVRVGHVDPAGRYAYSESYLGGRTGPANQPWPTQGPVIVGNRIYDVMYSAEATYPPFSVPAYTDLDLYAPFACAVSENCR